MEVITKIIIPFYKDVSKLFLDTIFPLVCLVCETEGELICKECFPKLNPTNAQICISCKKPTPFGLTHSYCLAPQSPNALISIYNYHDKNVAKILINGKYSFLPDAYKLLGQQISNILQKEYVNFLDDDNLVITPIPLHNFRKRWRGFNQVEILCQELGKQLGLQVVETLKREKITKTQKNLKKEQRLKNVSGAFSYIPNSTFNIQNSTVLLVDDVTTTGSTLLEATKVLKRNGANKVFCLTVARD